MSIKKTKTMTDSVIAISREENMLRAVSMKRRGSGVKILWARSSDYGDMDWRIFGSRCGLAVHTNGQRKSVREETVVAGFHSSGVVFYRMSLPAVKDKELPTMIRLQGEARLPLPAEEMNMTWRVDQSSNGNIPVTIAAARNEHLRRFADSVSSIGPERILLDCEAVVKVWKDVFSGGGKGSAVVVSLGQRGTLVCQVEDGRLNNAASLDVGVEDIIETEQNPERDKVDVLERVAQDMRSVLDMFGYADFGKVSIIVLSKGAEGSAEGEGYGPAEATEDIVTYLESGGFDIRRTCPEKGRFGKDSHHGEDEIYDYRVAIGLGLLAMDGHAECFDVFEEVYRQDRERHEKKALVSLRSSAVAAGFMVVLLAAVIYFTDVMALKGIESRLRGDGQKTNFTQIMVKRDLMKAAARQRPDVLAILEEMNSAQSNGIKLDGFKFARGKKVEITGQCENDEQVFKFQESLLKTKGISEVEIKNTAKDTRENKLKFTMDFHYRNYTKK